MRIQKKRMIISFLIIASMLISPFNGISIIANATENENNDSKSIKKIEVILKEASGGSSRKIFYKAENDEASEDTLDLDDIIIKASYDDNSTTDISLPSSDYDITTNINEVRSLAADNQKLTASISIKGEDNNETKLASTNDPTVTILPAKTVNPKRISLKLKDAKRTSFYVASDFISANDTLDEDDLELCITYETRIPKDDFYNIADENDKYDTVESETKTIPLTTTDYTVTTNVKEVREKVGNSQELTAELKYLSSKEGNNETYTIIKSSDNKPSDNPKVNILEPGETTSIKSIKLKLKDDKAKYYVDNGFMSKDDTLDLDDFILIGTYETGYKTDSTEYNSVKTEEREIPFESSDYTTTTNIDKVRKVIFYNKKSTPQAQEVTVTLNYKNGSGTAVALSASAKVTILPPKAVNGVVTIEPQNIYYGSTGSNKYGVVATDVKNDKFDIQCALDMASAEHNLVVHFPAGNYYLSNSLYIHSNTTLKFDQGAALIRNSNADNGVAAGTTDRLGVNHNILKIAPYNSTTTSSVGGYKNGENITIDGGIFDGGIISEATSASNILNLGHVNNLTIKNATLKNAYGNHLIEIVAAQNVEITGCTFSGFRAVTSDISKTDSDEVETSSDPDGDLAEAIQIDVAHYNKDTDSKWTAAYLIDDTPCNNVNIHDNTFNDYPIAIGNHHSLDGHHHTNISITNNKISGTRTQNSGIKLYGCDNSNVSGNVITNYSTGIKASNSTGFTIANNSISTATYGIIDTDSSSGQIVSNNIDKLKNQGIIVYGSGAKASTVSKNKISNSQGCGIIVHTGASCDSLTSNTISYCTNHGIQVYNSGKVTTLKSNTVNSCQGNGINIYGSATATNVTKNSLNNCNGTGIQVYSSAAVTNIKSNTISTCNKYGVYVYGKASVKTISSNTIKNTKKNGIYVKNDKIKVTFKSNKLTRVGSTAIKINSKFTNKKTQKYTFAPKVVTLNLGSGIMTTQASNLKKIKLKVGTKSYTKSTKKKNYTFKFKKYTKSASSATVTFTDKNKNTVARVLDFK